jgi:hypothetical protein
MLSISDWNMTTQCAQSQKQERANKLLSKCESWVGDSNLGWGSLRERRCAPTLPALPLRVDLWGFPYYLSWSRQRLRNTIARPHPCGASSTFPHKT